MISIKSERLQQYCLHECNSLHEQVANWHKCKGGGLLCIGAKGVRLDNAEPELADPETFP